jgi:tRNA-dihydrouridine synthase B
MYLDKKALHFAPMEGITDEPYRLAMMRAYPEWDSFSTDFLRVPTVGSFTDKKIVEHFGTKVYADQKLKNKTTFQILTSARAQTEKTVAQINGLGFHHLDLNLGCPSKKVNAHKGGSFLLSQLDSLRPIIRNIRKTFEGTFTVKMRIGYKDDSTFIDSLKMFEDEGVEAITLHARTRDQMYKGIADWDYIKRAVELSNIPIIGNGDVWTVEDIERIFKATDCHAIMLGRGALKTPWLASLYRQYADSPGMLNEDFLLRERTKYLEEYFYLLEEQYRKHAQPEKFILSRFKSFSRNIFDDYADFEQVRSNFLRSTTLDEFKTHLDRL